MGWRWEVGVSACPGVCARAGPGLCAGWGWGVSARGTPVGRAGGDEAPPPDGTAPHWPPRYRAPSLWGSFVCAEGPPRPACGQLPSLANRTGRGDGAAVGALGGRGSARYFPCSPEGPLLTPFGTAAPGPPKVTSRLPRYRERRPSRPQQEARRERPRAAGGCARPWVPAHLGLCVRLLRACASTRACGRVRRVPSVRLPASPSPRALRLPGAPGVVGVRRARAKAPRLSGLRSPAGLRRTCVLSGSLSPGRAALSFHSRPCTAPPGDSPGKTGWGRRGGESGSPGRETNQSPRPSP